ncbi:DHA2 family efflux MFS transporter permease subunit [Saccharopolyspora rosea]|uniref:DHA2 family efflux MFS transporter permease subunit n=1 Tax=Saccharopolyspora rosea TaxID=524884 RepID=A0ABW3FZE1_9PSEU|nr:DHA2 family efflux MFS transporter permease subunit [Saccharopolyspora rosea]
MSNDLFGGSVVPGTEVRRKWLVLAICCMSLFIVGLDNTIVNLALPSIQRELHAPMSGLQWTIDAYTLVLASLLMLAGSTADRLGRRRVFQTGLVLFGLGSLLCGLAPNTGALIAFRMVQAIGGSMLNPVAMSIITNTFTDARERARAIGIWGGVVGLSMALGPVVGGALVDAAGWRSIFFINVPIGAAAVVLTALFVPESRAPRARRVDPVGQVLMMLLLGCLTFGIIEGPAAGWGSPRIVTCFLVAAAALVGLVGYERRREEPLLDPRFFASAPFSGATVIAVCGFAALSGFLFLNSLYLQEVRQLSPLDAGLLTLPMALMTAVCAPLSGRIVGGRGARLPLLTAGAGLVASGALLSGITASTPVVLLLVGYLVFGAGFGMLNAPITNTAVSGMPRTQAGVAAAVASTSRQVGASLGVAVIGSAVTAHIAGPLVIGFAPAARIGWWIIAGCGLAVLCLGALTTGRWARGTAERVAAQFDDEKLPVGAS